MDTSASLFASYRYDEQGDEGLDRGRFVCYENRRLHEAQPRPLLRCLACAAGVAVEGLDDGSTLRVGGGPQVVGAAGRGFWEA